MCNDLVCEYDPRLPPWLPSHPPSIKHFFVDLLSLSFPLLYRKKGRKPRTEAHFYHHLNFFSHTFAHRIIFNVAIVSYTMLQHFQPSRTLSAILTSIRPDPNFIHTQMYKRTFDYNHSTYAKSFECVGHTKKKKEHGTICEYRQTHTKHHHHHHHHRCTDGRTKVKKKTDPEKEPWPVCERSWTGERKEIINIQCLNSKNIYIIIRQAHFRSGRRSGKGMP